MKSWKRPAYLLAGLLILITCTGAIGGGCTSPAPPPPVAPAPTPAPDLGADVVGQLLDAHNLERYAHGLPALTLNPKLVASAQAHADHMAAVRRLAHQGIGDGDLGSRLATAAYSYSAAAENIAWNQPDVPSVMTSWINSPGHRADILGPYSECGFGVTFGPNHDPYWCADFASPPR